MKDNLFFGEEARKKLMDGVKKATRAVAVTLGTAGSNSLIQCIERPGHYTTNDGATILGSIKFADPLEEMGRQVLYEAVSRANKVSGDGSSTACVLTAAILEEGMKYIGKVSPMEIQSDLERCIPVIEKSLIEQKKEITLDNVWQVASISAENESIGKTIQEIYKKIGKKGIIQWDISKTSEDSYEIGTGIRVFDASYITGYMCDLDSKGGFTREAKLTDPRVLLARRKITSVELDPICKTMFEMGERQLLIFCDEMDVNVIGDLLNLQMKNGFRTVVVKMPVIWKGEWWEDLKIASGGKIVDALSPTLEFGKLGKFERVKVTREETIIEGTQDLKKHIMGLHVDGSDEALQRAERLNAQTARYFVGAPSESALAYRRLKVEDAINAASCALENGVVAGGGIALLNASKEVDDLILKEALRAPFKQIMMNAGKPDAVINGKAGTLGFDSRTLQIVNMFDAGIVDPTDVVVNAVKNAIGVAASILTIGTVVTFPEQELINNPQ